MDTESVNETKLILTAINDIYIHIYIYIYIYIYSYLTSNLIFLNFESSWLINHMAGYSRTSVILDYTPH